MPFLLGFALCAAFLAIQLSPPPSPPPPGGTASAGPVWASPSSSAAPSASPSAAPSAAPSATPTAAASTTPAPATSATPQYKFVYRATPSPATTSLPGSNAPEIDEIDLNDSTIVTPGALHLRVLTSAAVVSVTAETLGRSVAIPLLQRGTFAYDGFIPAVPFFLRNQTYDVRFVASAQDGRTALVTLPLTLK